jgi:anti-sigma regulatory factor (Ser/Thr protein kinase)
MKARSRLVEHRQEEGERRLPDPLATSARPERSLAFERSWPAVPTSVPLARHAIVELARAGAANAEQLHAVRLACSEAITNVVRHAYRGGHGLVHVDAALADGELWVLVADDGCGLGTRSDTPGMGQGLRLIAAVSDDLTIVERAEGGTELRMRFSLARATDVGHARGSVSSATSPAAPRFSTTR